MSLFLKVLLAPLIPVAAILGIVMLAAAVYGIVSAVFGKGKTKKDPEEEKRQIQQKIEEKYKDVAVLKKYKDGSLRQDLLRLGKEALKNGELEAAREYLEDCRALADIDDVRLALAEYYAAAGDRKKASELLNNEMECSFPEASAFFLAVVLHLTDQPEEALKKGKEHALKHTQPGQGMSEDTYQLFCAAKEQLVKDALASCGARLQEAQQLARKGDPAGAADICKGLYDVITEYAEKKDLPKHREILTELAWQTAVYCCGARTYQQYEVAEAYLNKEKGCSRYPTYYYIHMLAKTRGGVSGFEDTTFLYKALYTDVERAIREGLPGAEQVKERLSKTYLRAIEIGLDNARFALEQIEAEEAFEEAHGMSREEYRQRQKEAAEEQARAERADRLRKKIELAEQDADLLAGGGGYSMEEKLARGELSYSDHDIYAEVKEKYIEWKTR